MYDQLNAVAEVAIGLAGFASVATVLRGQSERDTVLALQRLLVLLFFCFPVAFLSFLPAILEGVGLSSQGTWRTSAGILVLLILFYFSPMSPLMRNLQKVRDAGYSRPELRKDWGFWVMIVALLLAAAIVLGAFEQSASAAFLAALVLLLLVATSAFLRLVVALVGGQDE